jgi:excisionase family DNA binding protein
MTHPLTVPTVDRSVFINEAAEALGVSRRTVYYRIRQGRLRTIRTRNGSQRVLWSSIEALRCEHEGDPLPVAAAGTIATGDRRGKVASGAVV